MHLHSYLAIILGGLGTFFKPTSAASLTTLIPDLGYWDVNVTISRGAQGHEAQFTWAVYSGNPDKTIYDQWSFDPYSGNITSQRNTRDFSITVGSACGAGTRVILKQSVAIGQRTYWLIGQATPSFKVVSANGRGGEASFRVNATLDSGAVDVCGRPLNPEFE